MMDFLVSAEYIIYVKENLSIIAVEDLPARTGLGFNTKKIFLYRSPALPPVSYCSLPFLSIIYKLLSAR
jgi:hypothetical protein